MLAASPRLSGAVAAGLAITLAALIGACGASRPGRRARAHPITAKVSGVTAPAATAAVAPSLAPGQLLVFFKRVVGADPVASQLTVDRDGRASAALTLGGLDGEKKRVFKIPAERLRKLRELIRHTRLRDTTCCDARQYLYFVSIAGHTWRLQQGRIPPPLRRLVGELNSITNLHTAYTS